MSSLQVILSGVGSLVVYGMLIAAVVKLYRIAADLSEIKEALQDIKRNTQDAPPPGLTPAATQSSPESLMRALGSVSANPAKIESQR
jgi:hypothetical protein